MAWSAVGEAVDDLDVRFAERDVDRRLVAIGDIHGAVDGLRSILVEAGLIDGDDLWIGGDAILVQTGDFLDRGAGALEAGYLLMDLQQQAAAVGGRVEVLLGNHEVLNLISDLRDVTAGILSTVIDDGSEERLEASCDAFVDYRRDLAKRQRQRLPRKRDLIVRCHEEQQLGLVEYLEEIGPEGRIGKWMRELPAVAQFGEVAFLHAGISAEFADSTPEEINREVRREIASFDEARQYLIDRELILPTSGLPVIVTVAQQLKKALDEQRGKKKEVEELPPSFEHMLSFNDWLLVRPDGPLWFRGYARWTEAEGAEQLPAILDEFGAERIVVAHTPQRSKSITPRFGARVFLIDTGMLTSYYQGRPSALEIDGGSFTAIYRETKVALGEPKRSVSPVEPAG